MIDLVRSAVVQSDALSERMVMLSRQAFFLLGDAGFSSDERATYREAVAAVLAHLRATCPTHNDLAVAYHAKNADLRARAAAACAGAQYWERVSPAVALDVAVFERVRELGGFHR